VTEKYVATTGKPDWGPNIYACLPALIKASQDGTVRLWTKSGPIRGSGRGLSRKHRYPSKALPRSSLASYPPPAEVCAQTA